MKEFKLAFTFFALPVGLFFYVLFNGYPEPIWTFILIGFAVFANL